MRLRKYRQHHHAFLAEGTDLVVAGLLAGLRPQVVFVLEGGAAERSLIAGGGTHGEVVVQGRGDTRAAGDAEGRGAQLAEAAERGLDALLLDTQVVPVTRRVAQKISTLETPPDVIAVFPEVQPPPLDSLRGAGTLVVYADQVNDPGNLGTLIRAAAAFGAAAVCTSPRCAEPFGPKVVRGSMGSVFSLPLYSDVLLTYVAKALGSPHIYGLTAHGGVDVRSASLRRPALLCVGAERQGLSPQAVALAQALLTIPLAGAESLNAGVAGAVALYEFTRRASGSAR